MYLSSRVVNCESMMTLYTVVLKIKYITCMYKSMKTKSLIQLGLCGELSSFKQYFTRAHIFDRIHKVSFLSHCRVLKAIVFLNKFCIILLWYRKSLRIGDGVYMILPGQL